jgi:hypothetical protein
VDDRRPTFPLDDPCKPTGSDAAPEAENIRPVSSSAVYCGADREVSEGFAIALRMMGLDANFLPVGLAPVTNTPNTEDS